MTPLAKRRKSPARGVFSAKLRAWSSLSRYVRAIEPRCVTSGHPTTEAGHFIHNSDKPNKQLGGNMLWLDIRNIHGQCGYCNRWKSGEGAKYSLFLIHTYGDGIIQELHKLHQTPKKWTIEELDAVAKKYTDLLSEVIHTQEGGQ